VNESQKLDIAFTGLSWF